MSELLFSPIEIAGRTLKNRLAMAPLYLGYAGPGGAVSELMLHHYRLMAKSGVALVVVENSNVCSRTSGGIDRVLRADDDAAVDGLARLAESIRAEGALCCLQINHQGRFANIPLPMAVSNVDTMGLGRSFHELGKEEIAEIVKKFAQAAARVKKAGFDMVELHGGTGYLLSQFVSPWTNRREDEYGGNPEKRMRFGLEVVSAVKEAVGDLPLGYRFLADEWQPGGLGIEEASGYAEALEKAGVDYLSPMAGTWESMLSPENMAKTKEPGYFAALSARVKERVKIPVMAAGRVKDGAFAESMLKSGAADMAALARPLFADPEWPEKARQGRDAEIIACDPGCPDACMQMVMTGKPAYCTQWAPDKTRQFKDMFA